MLILFIVFFGSS